MPTNRGYRPVVTLLNAVDYSLAGEALNPVVFHSTMFFWYLVQGVVMWAFARRLLEKVAPEQKHHWTALGLTAFYLFHTSNAETINYIISRSDSFSTLCVLLTLLLYQWQAGRRYLLYLLPLVVGMFTKEVVFMVVGLIGFYHLFFEEGLVLGELRSQIGWKKLFRSFLHALPAFLVGFALLYHNLVVMTDTSRLTGGLAHPRLDYFTSQFVVVGHYLTNFVLPVDLSVDPDFKVTADILTWPKLKGLCLILGLHLVALLCTTRKVLTPIAYGLIWFFLCLAPTSTFNPLYQVCNDHRTFLPYVGLCLALGWAVKLISDWCAGGSAARQRMGRAIPGLVIVVIALHAWGTYQRNEVWGSDETLWRDAVEKGPTNGRALMNYGLVKMKNGEYGEAEQLFMRAVALLPTWPYIHVNLGVLRSAVGRHKEAESSFRTALQYGAQNPESYYYYGQWLMAQGREGEALKLLERGHQVSPKHVKINSSLAEMRAGSVKRLEAQQKLVSEQPTAANYISLSLILYQREEYAACIEACFKALELEPDNVLAYNNLCSAYCSLEQWDKAVEAGEKAVSLDPDFTQAQANLRWARSGAAEED
jgi:tetratricopeptide (TPR) repeat protein